MTRKIKKLLKDFDISSFRFSGGMGGSSGGVPDDLLTTKGDTHGYTTENARVPIGVDSTVLTADSTEALGLKWAAAAAGFSAPTLGDTVINSGSTNATINDLSLTDLGRIQRDQNTLSTTGTVDLDFTANELNLMPAMTGAVVFTGSNYVAGGSKKIIIVGGASTGYGFTFPASWNFAGDVPTDLISGKYAIMTLTSTTTAEGGVIVDYVAGSFAQGVAGGTVTTSGLYTYVTFTASGTAEVGGTWAIDALVVGAGGGSGQLGGGGGCGGVILGTSHSLAGGAYPVVVGEGVSDANGGSSSFNGLTAGGGGRGGTVYQSGSGNGASGSDGGGGAGGGGVTGSGVGSGSANSLPAGWSGTAHTSQSGGSGYSSHQAGGGGGIVGSGGTGSSGSGGSGGAGIAISEFSNFGDGGYFGGGGGGGGFNTSGGGGGSGGGANGKGTATGGNDGDANTGGGAGGSGNTSSARPAGGSGVVIIRYLTP
jgi:hypothetical protein